ncbi:putative reverse transcriptase domain-containing protein [Tanacetum coccineum]
MSILRIPAVTYTAVSILWKLSDIDPQEFIGPEHRGLPCGLYDHHMCRSLYRPPSPDYIPGPEETQSPPPPDFVPEPPLPAVDSPTTNSPGYILESDLEEDDDKDPEEDPVDYPANGGDDGAHKDEPSDDDEDEEVDIEADDEEEEEHPAPANSTAVTLPAIDQAPSAKETEPFKTDESAAHTTTYPAYRATARISIPALVPTPVWSDAEVARLLAISTLPLSPLSPWSSPLPQIPFPPLPPIPSPSLPLSPPLHVSAPPPAKSYIGYVITYSGGSTAGSDYRAIGSRLQEAGGDYRDVGGRSKEPPKVQQTTSCTKEAGSRSNPVMAIILYSLTKYYCNSGYAMIDQGVTAILAARDANTNGVDSHNSGTSARRNERATRECTYPDFMKCQPLNFKGTKGVVELTQWIEKMETGHFKRECPKLKNNNNRGNQVRGGNTPAKVYAVRHAGTNPDSNVMMGMFLLNNCYASILFDTGADRSFVSTAFSFEIDITPTALDHYYDVELADRRIIGLNNILRGCTLNILNHPFNIDLMPVELGSFDAIIGMDWLVKYQAIIVCADKIVHIPWGNETLIVHSDESNQGYKAHLHII